MCCVRVVSVVARRAAPRRVLKVIPPAEALRSAPLGPPPGHSQSDLFADPMPARVEPCLALLASKPPSGSDWSFEVKWDGYRLAVHRSADAVRILTRGGHDWTRRFPAIAAAAQALDAHSFILDGEGVVLDEEGRSDFNQLQQDLGGRGGKAFSGNALLYAFDLLYLDGHDLRRMSLEERRHILQGLLNGDAGRIRLSEDVDADGLEFLGLACRMGLEGIIAKKRSAAYRPGRGGDWLKIKCVQSDSFAIIGYEPSSAALGGVGNLLLAAESSAGLTYVGSVGTGFSAASARSVRVRLDQIVVDRPVVALKRRGIVWTRPELLAEIAFRGWTGDRKLRHASYKGLREAADEASVFRLH